VDKFRQIRHNINKSLNNRTGAINNAMDGSVYRKFSQSLSDNVYSISLNINSDGAPLVNSRNISMWPVIASITELNPSSRESFSNLLFLGFWISESKPLYNLFFSKSIEKLNLLLDKIIEINGTVRPG